jgi:hypothetical protein
MDRCGLNKDVLNNWIGKVGGMKSAAKLIESKLKCSDSKAEKIAGGRYPSRLTHAEQKELALLLKCAVSKLFPVVSATEEVAS